MIVRSLALKKIGNHGFSLTQELHCHNGQGSQGINGSCQAMLVYVYKPEEDLGGKAKWESTKTVTWCK